MVKNPSKFFFSGTGRPISTKLGMLHRGLQPLIVCSNDDPRVTLTYFTARSNLLRLFYGEKVKTVDLSETIAACNLKVGRCRKLIEIIRDVSIEGQGIFFTIFFQVFYVFCFTRPRYQVSVYRASGPLLYCLPSLK